ncbi:MAG: nonstructural protein [Wigfec virus K19_161]|nr:MAG: nonstructural protein [Wigfec virus K19_161]
MNLSIFSVYDSKAKHFHAPYTLQNTAVALRAFSAAVNEPGSQMNQFPADFSLIEIGSYDDATGVLTSINHVNHGPASQFIKE